MHKFVIPTLFMALLLTACATPQTIMKHKKTGEVVTCGGSSVGSVAGGAIGYHIQKSNDEDCVEKYKSEGYEVQSRKE
jgi:phage tail tape-measure protein